MPAQSPRPRSATVLFAAALLLFVVGSGVVAAAALVPVKTANHSRLVAATAGGQCLSADAANCEIYPNRVGVSLQHPLMLAELWRNARHGLNGCVWDAFLPIH
ncbi:MAG: hypothetical protein ACKN9T_15500 [Candidatus Methylumidiphilus sp.]